MPTHDWQKSSFSAEAANCVYVARAPIDRQKSSHSAQGSNCLSIAAPTPDVIKIRESDAPDIILTATPATLGVFIRAAKAGRFDRLTNQ
ncbi:DUF397 domain-containing protein [Streptomyces milbemycinicus]|uniref:DUF397 domain-containing protein n=1 Tax=Streptomyces milbemycinicus TaxID=476552 RepID=A0ABW8LED9_9ACTN